MMQRLTPLDRLEVIKKYYQSGSSVVATRRLLTRELGRRHRYSAQVISRTVKKFESELTLQDNKLPKSQRNVRSDENIAAAAASVVDEPNLSITRNWSDRMRQCQRARGGHLNNILFHT
uniref:DUF4817 domain-containing protein n=1 Tax=Photinus pyralis TaxID=7054 RepID=A0A1Y1MFP0_PHOPY